MTGGVAFTRELENWAGLAGYELTPAARAHDGRAVFWNKGGEVRLLVAARDDGWFVLTDSDRLGEEQFVLAAVSLPVVEKYLWGSFGLSIRSRRGMPDIKLPYAANDVDHGFSIGVVQFDGRERQALLDSAGQPVAVCGGGALMGTRDMARLSLYLNSTVPQIQESFENTDGRPLFRPRT